MLLSSVVLASACAAAAGCAMWAIDSTIQLANARKDAVDERDIIEAMRTTVRDQRLKIVNQASELRNLLALRAADKLRLRVIVTGLDQLGQVAHGCAPAEIAPGQEPLEAHALCEDPIDSIEAGLSAALGEAA